MTVPLVLLAGVLIVAGAVAIVIALVPATPQLAAALARVASDGGERGTSPSDAASRESPSTRVGRFLFRHSLIGLTDRQQQSLRLQDKSVTEFYSDKAVMAIVGALMPAMASCALVLLAGFSWALPGFVAAVGAVIGFFVPDLILLRTAGISRSSAIEALLVFIDLVTLERLANASATQALHNAANLTEAPVFTQIRVALERAQLEQQSPYGELRRLGTQLNLPELTDIADVMQLDETGAALSGTLRARVRELRDAHLSREQIKASGAAEGMTLYMTLPAMVFGLIFMVPPLLRILYG
jgi:tight adherence protein C